MPPPWDVTAELRCYLAKAEHVSPACRLTLDEEALLAEHAPNTQNTAGGGIASAVRAAGAAVLGGGGAAAPSSPSGTITGAAAVGITNRRRAIAALRSGQSSIPLALPTPLAPPDFDAVNDETCLSPPPTGTPGPLTLVAVAQRKAAAVAYARPESCAGAAAAALLHDAVARGNLTLGGRRGFFFLYDLLSGAVTLSLLGEGGGGGGGSGGGLLSGGGVDLGGGGGEGGSGGGEGEGGRSLDSSFATGALLLRLLPASESGSKGVLMSLLRCMADNENVARTMPR
jgi:hypothetical protein